MKKNMARHAETNRSAVADLYAAILKLENTQETEAFLADLCTPTEIAAFADRWSAARLLYQGKSQRDVAAQTGVALGTVTRVAKFLGRGSGGYLTILKREAGK